MRPYYKSVRSGIEKLLVIIKIYTAVYRNGFVGKLFLQELNPAKYFIIQRFALLADIIYRHEVDKIHEIEEGHEFFERPVDLHGVADFRPVSVLDERRRRFVDTHALGSSLDPPFDYGIRILDHKMYLEISRILVCPYIFLQNIHVEERD